MRLKPRDIQAIRQAATEVFGNGAVVRLFGSRARDDLRGGDIDLLIEVDPGQDSHANQSRFRDRLFERIDEQKVDVVFLARGQVPSAFVQMVARGAVPLP